MTTFCFNSKHVKLKDLGFREQKHHLSSQTIQTIVVTEQERVIVSTKSAALDWIIS
jgi:hypothetical protein